MQYVWVQKGVSAIDMTDRVHNTDENDVKLEKTN